MYTDIHISTVTFTCIFIQSHLHVYSYLIAFMYTYYVAVLKSSWGAEEEKSLHPQLPPGNPAGSSGRLHQAQSPTGPFAVKTEDGP